MVVMVELMNGGGDDGDLDYSNSGGGSNGGAGDCHDDGAGICFI